MHYLCYAAASFFLPFADFIARMFASAAEDICNFYAWRLAGQTDIDTRPMHYCFPLRIRQNNAIDEDRRCSAHLSLLGLKPIGV